MNQSNLIELEKIEKKYLLKYFHFLKFVEEEILNGLNTKNDIKQDWFDKWNIADNEKKISDFNTGAERVIYALINSKGFGIPNSCPVGSDLMFEVDDAYIHIDFKTVQTSNIGDFTNSIFVGNNQISYNSKYTASNQERDYTFANLPFIYKTKDNKTKYCLTYFISILHDATTFETLCMYITCCPNGLLQPIYQGSVFKAGKNPNKVRYNIFECKDFKLINGRRILVSYMNNNIKEEFKKKLKFLNNCYNSQSS